MILTPARTVIVANKLDTFLTRMADKANARNELLDPSIWALLNNELRAMQEQYWTLEWSEWHGRFVDVVDDCYAGFTEADF